MNTKGIFSSKSDEWSTPQEFYEQLNEEFDFTLDPCATDENHKTQAYYTIEDDGLQKNWGGSEFSATHRTPGFPTGYESVTKNHSSLGQRLCFSFLQGRIRDISTTTLSIVVRSGS